MVDVPAQIDAVTRTLRTGEIDGEPSRIQALAQEYPASIEDVWLATTTPERIARWFLPVSGNFRVGGKYQLTGNASGEILECAPPAAGTAEYRVTWEFGGGISWVTVRLHSLSPNLTRFELEHTSRTADIPAEMWDTFGPGATGVGWDNGFLGLALHLHTQDSVITPEQGAEWGLSDEGVAFARAAADKWADAHVASGANRDIAARNADATFGFYTGQEPQE